MTAAPFLPLALDRNTRWIWWICCSGVPAKQDFTRALAWAASADVVGFASIELIALCAELAAPVGTSVVGFADEDLLCPQPASSRHVARMAIAMPSSVLVMV